MKYEVVFKMDAGKGRQTVDAEAVVIQDGFFTFSARGPTSEWAVVAWYNVDSVLLVRSENSEK